MSMNGEVVIMHSYSHMVEWCVVISASVASTSQGLNRQCEPFGPAEKFRLGVPQFSLETAFSLLGKKLLNIRLVAHCPDASKAPRGCW